MQWAGTFGKREAGNQPIQEPPVKLRRKQNTIPLRMLNADPLAQFIGMDTIAEALIDDVPTKVLLDTATIIYLLPISYAKAAGLEIKPLSLITDEHVTMGLAAGQYSEAIRYTEFNLKEPRVSDYDLDRLALLAEDDSYYSKRVPVALGTKTLASIIYAMKEGKIELLEVWKQTKIQRSFAKLRELVGFCQAAITCTEKQGIELPQFEDHTPYSNKGMEDLLDIDEVIYAVSTVIIPPRQIKIIKGWTSLVLYGTKMNVATEPLKKGDPPLPRELHLWSSHTRYNCVSQKIHVFLHNTKDKPVVIQKGTPVSHMVAANAIPEKVLLPGTLEALDKSKTNEAQQLSIEE